MLIASVSAFCVHFCASPDLKFWLVTFDMSQAGRSLSVDRSSSPVTMATCLSGLFKSVTELLSDCVSSIVVVANHSCKWVSGSLQRSAHQYVMTPVHGTLRLPRLDHHFHS